MERFFLVYKTVNKIKGEYYIGAHVTDNIDDGYLGSGKRLRYSLEKHGREIFEREILAVFDNSNDMFNKEAELVNEKTLLDPLCLNLKVGGYGGWLLKDASILWSSDFQKKRSPFNKKEWKEQNASKIKEWSTKGLSSGRKKLDKMRAEGWISPGFAGKRHTTDFKQHMSTIMSEAQSGEKNSQYGRRWIHSFVEKRNTKVTSDELQQWLDKGWIIGRKMKFD
jgi:hypothetical protein